MTRISFSVPCIRKNACADWRARLCLCAWTNVTWQISKGHNSKPHNLAARPQQLNDWSAGVHNSRIPAFRMYWANNWRWEVPGLHPKVYATGYRIWQPIPSLGCLRTISFVPNSYKCIVYSSIFHHFICSVPWNYHLVYKVNWETEKERELVNGHCL